MSDDSAKTPISEPEPTFPRRGAPVADPGLRASIETLIRREACSPVFQPVVDLRTGEIAGYEGLTRADPSLGFAHTGELFEQAGVHGLLWELEQVTRRVSFRAAGDWPTSALLFLNANPVVFADPRFVEEVQSAIAETPGLGPQRIVLEITERAESQHIAGLSDQVQRLKSLGFQIAIDDMGAGTSGLNRIMWLRPQWLKLDREIIQDLDVDLFKQNLIEVFVNFARMSGVRLVAEGIERREELLTLIDLGVDFGQGFHLAKPGRREQTIDPDAREAIRDRAALVERRRRRRPGFATVGAFMQPALTCGAGQTLRGAARRLTRDPAAPGIVVEDRDRYVGWVSREQANQAIGFAEQGDKPLGEVASGQANVVDPAAPLLDVLRAVSCRQQLSRLDPVVIQQDGRVLGVLTIEDLLNAGATAAQGIHDHTAPLTGLPTRGQCDRRLSAMGSQGVEGEAAFLDIPQFHRINETHGYEMGDMMLRLLAGILYELGRQDPRLDLVGHLADDRFLLLREENSLDEPLRRIVEEFETTAERFLRQPVVPREAEHASTSDHTPLNLRVVHVRGVGSRINSAHRLHQLAESLRDQPGLQIGSRSKIIDHDLAENPVPGEVDLTLQSSSARRRSA